MKDDAPSMYAHPSFRPVLRPGHNCWCLERASAASVVIDAADYFSAFAEACRAAKHQILILGWDFDRRERLHREDRADDLPDQLGAFLAALVRHHRNLKVYLLSWDFNMIYAAERELLPALKLRMQTPHRFHFRLDGRHPKGASHHQKVVVIDDQVAFAGGIDLSRWRWDTPRHQPDDPRRVDADGKSYPPFHDMMMVVEGDVAARLDDLARERWRRAGGRKIKPVRGTTSSPWPSSVKRQLSSPSVAISRTEPPHRRRPAVDEIKQLHLDAVASARDFIYIENQYFTANSLAEALGKRLAEPDGPEVILVLPKQTGGWLEQVTMDVLRARVVKRMQDADEHGRLRIYYPHQPGLGEDECISVHSKLLIVDDRLLRIGSSNASNRSLGLDTECDLAVEARTPGDAVQDFITDLRRRLLGEHLGCDVARMATAESETPSLIAVIERSRSDLRSLRPLDCGVPSELDDMVPDSGVIDPSEPFSADYFVAEYVPEETRPTARKRVIAFVAAIAVLLAMAAAWRWTPLSDWLSPQKLAHMLSSFSSPGIRGFIAIAGFVVASLLMVPLTLLAVVGGVVFGSWHGFAYVLVGALISSAVGFVGGRTLSRGMVQRISGSRLSRLSKRLAEQGTLAVALLRLLPIAPFAVFNLVAGASHLGFRQFIVGSLLGLMPGLAAISLFSRSLWEAVTVPSLETVGIAVAIGATLFAAAWLMKKWLRSG